MSNFKDKLKEKIEKINETQSKRAKINFKYLQKNSSITGMFIVNDSDGTIDDDFINYNQIHKFGKRIIPSNESNNGVIEEIDDLQDYLKKSRDLKLPYNKRYSYVNQIKIPFYVHPNKKGKDVLSIQIQFDFNISEFLKQLFDIIEEHGESVILNKLFKISMDNEYNISLEMVDKDLEHTCREYMNSKYGNDGFYDIVLETFDDILDSKEMSTSEISSIVYGWMNDVKPYVIDRKAVEKDRNELREKSSVSSEDFKDPFKNMFDDTEEEEITPVDDDTDENDPFGDIDLDNKETDDNNEDVVPF